MESVLASNAARRFAATAAEFCSAIEGAEHTTRASLLRALERLIPLLYHAAVELPDVEPDTSDAEDVPLPAGMSEHVHRVLGMLLAPYDFYQEIFNPVDGEDRTPVGGTLSGDLAEIYEDLWQSLALERTTHVGRNDVVWEWKSSFASHWGRHASSALRVINALLRTEFVDVLEESPTDA